MTIKMLTRKDLMKRWGVCARTLDRWVKLHNIPRIKSPINGHVYFKEEDIKEWEKKMFPLGNPNL